MNNNIDNDLTVECEAIDLPSAGKAPKRKKLLRTILICLLVLAVLGGGAAIFLTSFVNVGGRWISTDTQRLDLRDAGLTDLDGLDRLTGLVTLDVRGNDISFASVDALREVLPDCEIIWDVEMFGTRYGSDAAHLDLTGQSIDFDELFAKLDYFTRLEQLTLVGCDTPDEELFDLRDRREGLSILWDVTLGSASFLSDSTELSLSDAGIEDITLLGRMPQLTGIDLSDNSVTDISALGALANLVSLDLSGNGLKDISALASLSELAELDLSDDYVKDLTPLSGLSNLRTLNLNGCFTLSDLSPLMTMTGLRWLDIRDCACTDISPLAGLTGLEYLDAGSNPLGGDISALAGLTNLTELHMVTSHIEDISPLAGMTRLTRLNLYNNRISDLAALEWMTGLVWLNLNRNQVTDINVLRGLSHLEWLNISLNKLSSPAPLHALTALRELLVVSCDLDKAERAALSKALPDCAIKF